MTVIRQPLGWLGRIVELLIPRVPTRFEQRFMDLSWLALMEEAAEDVIDEHHAAEAKRSDLLPVCRCGLVVRSWRTHWGREMGRRVARDPRARASLIAYQEIAK